LKLKRINYKISKFKQSKTTKKRELYFVVFFYFCFNPDYALEIIIPLLHLIESENSFIKTQIPQISTE